MSLPVPSTAGPAGSMGLDPKQLQAIDAPLIALTQQCNGDLRQLLFAFFSFLHRRTDFYLVPHPDDVEAGKPASMGFNQGDAEKLLIAAFRQFPLRRIPKGTPGKKAPAPAKTESKPTPDKPVPPKETKQPEKPKEEETKVEKEAPKEIPPSAPTTTAKNMQDVQYSEKGLQIPVGNGGSAKTYKWTQTLEECTVLVGVPKDLRGKDLSVTITTSTLSVKSKKPIVLSSATAESPHTMTTFLEGNLVQKVRADESTWSVEGGVVTIILDKRQKTFWDAVLEGDEKIDTELVDNRRRIGDYDDATQAQFRKIIFDQEQYHKGGPTSDEILGQQSSIPPLPTGVEYIDKKTLDDHDKKTASSK